MRKTGIILLAALILLLAGSAALAEGAPDDPAEWTVMIYLCGSDLESKYGYATLNLEEIGRVEYPENFRPAVVSEYFGEELDEDALTRPGRVDILIETGGAKAWHTEELGMDVAPSALQRWRYNTMPLDEQDTDEPNSGYQLMQTLPLQSMADPETLSDFIRWGRETCPAKKYALVLWDHGDGARTGLFIDELFDGDVMYLYELREALQDADTHFEAMIIDACLMANVETAYSVRKSTDWLVASEENVPGKGTAIGEWLQQLIANPWGDGKWLGRCVCDATAIKYANDGEEKDSALLTWSVIDLSKLPAFVDACKECFRIMYDSFRKKPTLASIYMNNIYNAAVFGDGQQNMRDIGSLFYNQAMIHIMNPALRGRILQALADVVNYCVRGSGRNEARGMSFCYPMSFDSETLDIYAQNFPLPYYMAIIDAVSPWSAPEWVYESVERLPEIDSIEELRVYPQKKVTSDGMPCLRFGRSIYNLDRVYYRLYKLDEATGEVVRLGRTDCISELSEDDGFDLLWRAADPMHWPAIDGQLICMDLIQLEGDHKLYNVPVSINGKNSVLRLGREVNYAKDEADRINDYRIYGVWEGYDENSDLPNRSVEPLAMLAGQEYRLLYPIDEVFKDGRLRYVTGAPATMYRSLRAEERPLPVGTYYLEYAVVDLFMRETVMERIEIHWDGQTMTIPEVGSWENG